MVLKNTFTHDFGAFKMVLDTHDPDVSKQIREHGWYIDEKFDTEVFRRELKRGMTFVDLGANVGFYTMYGRSIVGRQGRVFAFEPFPRNSELIKASVKLNSYANVTVVECAVSDADGSAALYLSPEASSEHSLLDLGFQQGGSNQEQKSVRVKVVRLDDYFENNVGNLKIDFIKMDIEGSEYKAFGGMEKILAENQRIVIMAEFWPNGFRRDGKDPYEFLDALVKRGFEVQLIDNLRQEVYPVSPKEMKSIEATRTRDKSNQNEVMRIWGWYTNLICSRP